MKKQCVISTLIFSVIFFTVSISIATEWYPPKLTGECFEKPCTWPAVNNELLLAKGQYGAEFIPTLGSAKSFFVIIKREGDKIVALEKYGATMSDVPSTDVLNKYRATSYFQFKEVQPFFWIFTRK